MAGIGRLARAVLLQTQSWSSSAYAALSAGDPGDAMASLVEPTIGANGYARQLFSWFAVSVPASGAPAKITNANVITFTSTGVWNPSLAMSHIAVMINPSGNSESSFVGTCSLNPARLVDRAGIVITIPAGALELSIGLIGG